MPPESPEPRCISCGYSLAGLPRESLCPECAFPVARSLDATPLLRTAEPCWLRGVWLGFRLLRLAMMSWLIALLAMLPALCIMLLAMSFNIGPSDPPWLQLITAVVSVFAGACFLIGLLLLAVGLWLVTVPTHGPQCPPLCDRLPLRWLGIPLALMPLFLLALTPVWRLSNLPQPGILAIRAGVQVSGLAALFLLARIVEHFERGTPSPPPDLLSQGRSLRRNLIGLAIIFILGWLILIVNSSFIFTMPMGFAPFLLGLNLMGFDGSFKRLRDGIADEIDVALSAS